MESNPTGLLFGIAHWHIYVCEISQIREKMGWRVLFLSEGMSLEIFKKWKSERNVCWIVSIILFLIYF